MFGYTDSDSTCICTSLNFSFFLFLCLWISVSLSSCIMTHFICIYFSSSHYLSSFSLNIRISLRLYWLLGRVYVRLLIRVSLCLLFECLHRFPAILLLIVRVSFRLLICISIYVSLYVSQYPRILPLILRVYVCTSLYLCFYLTFCLWMCIPVSEYIIIYSCCVCMSHDPCFSLFLWFLCLCSAILSLIVRI